MVVKRPFSGLGRNVGQPLLFACPAFIASSSPWLSWEEPSPLHPCLCFLFGAVLIFESRKNHMTKCKRSPLTCLGEIHSGMSKRSKFIKLKKSQKFWLRRWGKTSLSVGNRMLAEVAGSHLATMREDWNLSNSRFCAENVSVQRRESKTSAQNSLAPRVSPRLPLPLTFKWIFKFPVFAEASLR